MTWFRVDDKFPQHPKVLRIPRVIRKQTLGTWTLAGAWTAGNLMDGWVPFYVLDELGADQAEIDVLLKVGLWEARTLADEDGVQFHDYLDWNRSKEQVLEERAKAADRQKRAREKAAEKRRLEQERDDRASRRESRRDGYPLHDEVPAEGAFDEAPDEVEVEGVNTPSNPSRRDGEALPQEESGSHGVTHGEVRSTSRVPRPDPTRPDQTKEQTPLFTPDGANGEAPHGSKLEQAWEAWWHRYPRKQGKGDARKAWDKARAEKRKPVGFLQAAVDRLADDPNLPADKSKIPMPATWLNQERWDDEPYPAAFGAAVQPMRANGEIDVDALLGKDRWQPPSPPDDIQPNSRAFIEWTRKQYAARYQDRLVEAQEKLARRKSA